MFEIETLLLKGEDRGLKLQTDFASFYFGNGKLTRAQLSEVLPKAKFSLLKQVHGRTVLEASTDKVYEADGHFTTDPNVAVVSITADCVPVLLAAPANEEAAATPAFAAALHAGWRGVAQNIVAASKDVLPGKPTLAVIGPHIRQKSFEVGLDVVAQLLKANPLQIPENVLIKDHKDPSKKYFNLTELVRGQLLASFPGITILEAQGDTFSDSNLCSFRRDKDKAGRQYSFVVLNEPKTGGITK